MKLPAYPRTKPSGVEWLGDVPDHWETTRFRFCVSGSNAGEVIDRSYWHSGDELLFSCQRESMISDFPDFPLRKRTTENDLLVTRNGTPYVHVPPANAIYSNVVQRCTLKNGPLRSFVALALETACERLRGDGYGVSIPSFSYEKWCDLSLPLPPPAEQRSIAAFLDRETGRVDRLVAKKRVLIERLKEKRTALISRTVTRGLPPAAARAVGLPENPPLKPSGVEWLADIPAHWEVVPLGYLVHFSGGATPDKSNSAYWDGSIPWVSPKDMKVSRIADAEDHVSPEALANSALRLMPVDSVLIVVRGMILAHSFPVALTTAPVTINQDMKAVACGKRVMPHYLSWSFTGFARTFVSFADESAHGTRKLETGTLTRFPFLLPPLPEQAAIAAYLDAETAKLDALVGKVEAAVERLQEYRTALITAAVTGKIDVRKVAASG